MSRRPHELYRVMDEVEYLRLAPGEMPPGEMPPGEMPTSEVPTGEVRTGEVVRERRYGMEARRARTILLLAALAAGALGAFSLVRRARSRGARTRPGSASVLVAASGRTSTRDQRATFGGGPASWPKTNGSKEQARGLRSASDWQPMPTGRIQVAGRRRRANRGTAGRGAVLRGDRAAASGAVVTGGPGTTGGGGAANGGRANGGSVAGSPAAVGSPAAAGGSVESDPAARRSAVAVAQVPADFTFEGTAR